MRASVLLLVAVLTLLVGIDATSTTNKLQETRTEAVEGTDSFNTKRLLREEPSTVDSIATVDEERASIANLFKKSTSGATQWLKDKSLTAKLHLKAMPMNLDNSVQYLMAKGIDPDRVFTLLKLHKESNRKTKGFPMGEFMLWDQLTAAWTKQYPNWVSKIPKDFKMQPTN